MWQVGEKDEFHHHKDHLIHVLEGDGVTIYPGGKEEVRRRARVAHPEPQPSSPSPGRQGGGATPHTPSPSPPTITVDQYAQPSKPPPRHPNPHADRPPSPSPWQDAMAVPLQPFAGIPAPMAAPPFGSHTLKNTGTKPLKML